jgi:hypothetical protein
MSSNLTRADELYVKHAWRMRKIIRVCGHRPALRRRLHKALDQHRAVTGLNLSCIFNDSLCECGSGHWLRNVFLELGYKGWLDGEPWGFDLYDYLGINPPGADPPL